MFYKIVHDTLEDPKEKMRFPYVLLNLIFSPSCRIAVVYPIRSSYLDASTWYKLAEFHRTRAHPSSAPVKLYAICEKIPHLDSSPAALVTSMSRAVNG